MMNKISKSLNNSNFKKLIIFLIIFVSLIPLLFQILQPTNSKIIEGEKYQFCDEGYEISLLENTFNIIERDLYIFPEIENVKCIGKIIEVYEGENKALVYGTNKKVYYYFNLLGSCIILFLSFLILYNKRSIKNQSLAIFCFFVFSFTTNRIFLSDFDVFEIFSNFDLFVSFSSTILFFSSLFLYSYKFTIFTIYFFATFNYEYLGIFLLVLLLISSFKVELGKFEKYAVKILPIYFYIIRYISSLSQNLDFLWRAQFQEAYYGFSRFVDFQGDFFLLNCNKNSDIQYQFKFKETVVNCPEIAGYGPLRKLISVNFDIWITTLVLAFIVLILILISKISIDKKHPTYHILISFIFISPPANLIFHHMNPDIFLFSTFVLLMNQFKKREKLVYIILFLFSLWKIHVIGIFFGYLYYSLLNKDFKKLKINSFFIFLISVIYFIDTRITEPLKIPPAPDENWHFGVLADAEQLNYIISNSSTFIFYALYISIILLSLFIGIYFKDKIVNSFLVTRDYEWYGYVFWFFICMVYKNQTYRLALFLVLALHLIITSKNKTFNNILFLGIFLNPIFTTYETYTKYLSIFFNRIGIYFMFIVLIAFVYDDFISKTNYLQRIFKNTRRPDVFK